MKRLFVFLAVLLVGVVLLLSVLAGSGLVLIPITLLAGWFPAAARLWNAWAPAPPSILLILLGLAVLVTGSHAFLRWLFGALSQPQEPPRTLPWKWTLCAFGMMFCSLVAICSLVLTFHQLYWISRSSEPLFANTMRERIGLIVLADSLQADAHAAEWDLVKTRDAFWHRHSENARLPAAELAQPIWIPQDDTRLRAIILVPRRPERTTQRVTILKPGTELLTRHRNELPEVLQSFGLRASAQTVEEKPTLLP